jgi:small basic protein (TIGR04137 family)
VIQGSKAGGEDLSGAAQVVTLAGLPQAALRRQGEFHRSGNMTIDKSLKIKAGSIKSRNVLTRGERLAKLKEMDKLPDGTSPLGLPKVRVQKLALKKKKKVKKEEEETTTKKGGKK